MIDFKLTSLVYDVSIVNGKLVLTDMSDEVAQNVRIRLQTYEGEWFLDTELGVPWFQQILGKKDTAVANLLIRQEISNTNGVSGIVSFNPLFNHLTRSLSIYSKIRTVYGTDESVSVSIGG